MSHNTYVKCTRDCHPAFNKAACLLCNPYVVQNNSDNSDPEEGYFSWVQDMIFMGVRLLAAVVVSASVVGLVCGLRVAGWI